jgi:hypothetical protein
MQKLVELIREQYLTLDQAMLDRTKKLSSLLMLDKSTSSLMPKL